jgi:hypothetical protein
MEETGEYCITVSGLVGEHWSAWLGGLSIEHASASTGAPISRLHGRVRDQSELRGIINRIWDLNLSVVSVVRLSEGGRNEEIPIDPA